MRYDFFNKVVLVTGASSGIGEATAKLFARLGAQLVLVGRNEQNLLAAAARCEQEKGVKPLPIIADLGKDDGCEKTSKETLRHFGSLDILVNNAGIGGMDLIEHAKMEVFDQLFKVNLRGVYNLTRLLVPALIQSKGNVVNMSSIAGSVTSVGSLPYAMTKAAMDHFTRLIALELGPKGVRVNAVCPGITISKFHQRTTGVSDLEYGDFVRGAEMAIPLRKACTGDDIARTVVHIASDNSRLVTGTILQVDGGLQYSSVGNILRDYME